MEAPPPGTPRPLIPAPEGAVEESEKEEGGEEELASFGDDEEEEEAELELELPEARSFSGGGP